jgi:hypothetical protein
LISRGYVTISFSVAEPLTDFMIQVLVKVITKDGIQEIEYDNSRVAKST